MFANLIESASHQQDLARKGRFFLATLISYALVVASAGLVSIYAYDTHVAENQQDLELIGFVPLVSETERPAEAKNTGPKSDKTNQKNSPAMRTDAIDRVSNPTKVPDNISSEKSLVPEIPIKGGFVIGNTNSEATFAGSPGGVPGGTGNDETGPVVKMESAPPPVPEKKVEPRAPTVMRTSHVLNGQAVSLPKPPYPVLAKKIGVQGTVSVQIMIDVTGKIVSARASSGPPLLRLAAEEAAFRARFNPTQLNGYPVKVSGIITYNFSLQ